MLLLSHPTLTWPVRHTARALNRVGALREFWTLFDAPGQPQLQCVPSEAILDLPADSAAHATPCETARSTSVEAASSLDRAVSERVDWTRFGGVYAYAHCADATFRAAGQHGLLRVYDLLHDYWQQPNSIVAEEAALEPEWAATLGPEVRTFGAQDRSDSELHQADLVMVDSTFTLKSIERSSTVSGAIAILPPTPAPYSLEVRERPAQRSSMERVRVLFAGRLDQRSGLSYLFRACRELGPAASLTVIGDKPRVDCPRLERELRAVRWLPQCSAEILADEMAAHDVFVFPAIFDGGSHLLLAAMNAGLPIIATANSAAPDLVRDGEDGFIVPLRSAAALTEKIDLLRRERVRREEMGLLARQRAANYTWDRFERTVGASVAAALGRR